MFSSTKIIATIGPACDSQEKINSLYKAGMRIARLNFSHGSHEYFQKIIKRIRKVSDEIAIMLDTKGPEIRTGELRENYVELKEKNLIQLTLKKIKGDENLLQIKYNNLMKINKNTSIMLDNGLIELRVISKKKDSLIAKIVNGGVLGEHKSVTIISNKLDLDFMCDKDREDIKFGIQQGIDVIAASFVSSSKDVVDLKNFLKRNKSEIPIIAKIERAFALENIDSIIHESFGIMIARGDLGVEIPPQRIPQIQEKIICECNHLGKPVIVATQMLESMRDSPRPTRAEVADVSHAILHGADCVMLSAETAIGKYPIKAVLMMSSIAKLYDEEVQTTILDSRHSKEELKQKSVSLFITKSAYEATKTLSIKALIIPTKSGYSARKVSRFRPKCPIYAFTHTKEVKRQLQLSWGVMPFIMKKYFKKHEELLHELSSKIYEKKLLTKEDRVVVASGYVLSEAGHTNMIEIYKMKYLLDKKYLINV